jgi:HK97 gp10 family phage protein
VSTTSYSTIKVEGLRELERKLANLPRKVARKLGYRAVAKGASLIRDEARRRAVFVKGFSTGLVKKNIMQFRPTRRRSMMASGAMAAEIDVGVRLRGSKKKLRGLRRVMLRRGPGNSTRAALPAYYWFMVEFGTRKMAAQPFLRPAFETQKHAALRVMIDTLRKSIVDTQGEAA